MQPFLSMKFLMLIGKNYRRSRIGCALVHLLLTLAALAPKRSKKTVFFAKNQGATYSQETGCTLFALLNSIRAQGATSYGRFIG
ncbi:hypothetical protein P0D93_12120 [Pseudomonas sp. CBSPGW29]|nr:hypothetical protein P0D93_12120 [Pseudomonas sp. CBSPGW29]